MQSDGKERQILHLDMNAFYCSCHAAEEPALYSGKSTAVAGSPETRHGVVVTASYEARKRGVRATMTVMEALRVDPSLILIQPDFSLYRKYSKAVFDIVGRYTPDIEIYSIDECFADVTHSRLFGSAQDIAAAVQAEIETELHLPCSVGIAPNKFLAKMASDMQKPRGLTILPADAVPKRLWPLPVETMFGVGASTAKELNARQIHTIGDLAGTNRDRLQRWFGKRGLELHDHANGRDDSPVSAAVETAKSIGHSITLPADEQAEDALKTVLLNLSDQVGRRLRRHHLLTRTVQLTIRFPNRDTITRSRTLPEATDLTETIYDCAVQLLHENRSPQRQVRLLGVAVQNLQEERLGDGGGVQLNLFETFAKPDIQQAQTEKRRQLAQVTDSLRDKFGEDIVVRGRMLVQSDSKSLRNHKARGTSLQKDILRQD